MATRTEPIQSNINKFGDFKPISGTVSTIYVLGKGGNHPKSMKLLDDAGLMPYTKTEILSILMKDEQLKEALKGKWFYLAETGAKEAGLYTVNTDGSIAKGKGQSIEDTVRVWAGDNPLSLYVYSDYDASGYGGRFYLYAISDPDVVAPVVVGKPKLSLSEQADKLLSEIETTTASLRRSATQEDLEKKAIELGAKVTDLAKMLRPT